MLAAAVTPGGQVTGIDPATAAIAYARRRAPGNCSFTVGTAQRLGVPDGSFDVVTSTLAIHHIPEPERPAAFGEMYRALRPGGRLLVADFRPSRSRLALHSGGRAMRHSDPALIGDLAAAAGFRVENTATCPCCAISRPSARKVKAHEPAARAAGRGRRPSPFLDSHHDHYYGRGQPLAGGRAAIRKLDSTRSDAR